MKYCELSGWQRIIAEACRLNPELITVFNQNLENSKNTERNIGDSK